MAKKAATPKTKRQMITTKMKADFNRMLATLRRINKDYMPSERIIRQSEKLYGLSPPEGPEMSYDNIQGEAARAVRGVKEIKRS